MTPWRIPGPKPMSGISPLAAWSNELRKAMASCRILPGPGYRLKQFPNGVGLEIQPQGAAAAAPASGLVAYQITGLSNGDSVLAKQISQWGNLLNPPGANQLSGADITIAKDWHLRCSLTSEQIDGVTLNYSQLTDNTRFANDGTNGEWEVMFPRYVVGGIIWADSSSNGTGLAGINLLEVKPARIWARRYLQ